MLRKNSHGVFPGLEKGVFRSMWRTPPGKLLVLGLLGALAARAEDAPQVLETAGIKGGLVVHVGCGDGRLTAALRVSESFVAQGLDADVTQARENIRAAGVYGPVTAIPWDGG